MNDMFATPPKKKRRTPYPGGKVVQETDRDYIVLEVFETSVPVEAILKFGKIDCELQWNEDSKTIETIKPEQRKFGQPRESILVRVPKTLVPSKFSLWIYKWKTNWRDELSYKLWSLKSIISFRYPIWLMKRRMSTIRTLWLFRDMVPDLVKYSHERNRTKTKTTKEWKK